MGGTSVKIILTFLFVILSYLSADLAYSREQGTSLVRQARSKAMGGIGVGMADDDYAMFNNPAGLAGQELSGWRPLSLQIEGTLDDYLYVAEISDVTSGFTLDKLNALMGKDIGGRSSAMTLFMLPHFHLAYIADTQASINQYNPVNPIYQIGAMITHGIQLGAAWGYKRGRRAPDEFRWGFAGKFLFRKGGFYEIGTTSILQSSSDPQTYFAGVIGDFGAAFGGDLGVQYLRKLDYDTSFYFGSSLQDIAGTKFPDSRTQSIPMALNAGFGFKRNINGSSLTLGMDYRNILMATALSNKLHFGGEFGLGKVFFLRAGFNQLRASYGVEFNFWLLKIGAASFGEELDSSFGISSTRRFIFDMSFGVAI
jgi:hypothetical protein